MKRLWLLFAQTVTVALALWFIVATLKPEWLRHSRNNFPSIQAGLNGINNAPSGNSPGTASYRDAAGKAMPSVVNIYTSKEVKRQRNPWMNDPFLKRFFGEQPQREERQSSLGSGVIVSASGYILTNNHVVESADEIEVALTDGRKASAKIIGTDPETDLAVIKIDLGNLPVATLGNSDQAQVGDVVLAIGNPYGVGQTVTMGIVSAVGRTNLGDNGFQSFIQTDAAVNPGNSGGALIDVHGNLLGINTAIYSQNGGSVGIGFAIPIASARQVMESIISQGQVVRGWIGVELQEITPELADSLGLKMASGAIIAGVVRDGPAFRAGIKPIDILVDVEGKAVHSTNDMLNLVSQLKPGSNAKIKILRNNTEMVLHVVIGKRPQFKKDE